MKNIKNIFDVICKTEFIMPLIKSIQELSDEVDRLKKEIEELKK